MWEASGDIKHPLKRIWRNLETSGDIWEASGVCHNVRNPKVVPHCMASPVKKLAATNTYTRVCVYIYIYI